MSRDDSSTPAPPAPGRNLGDKVLLAVLWPMGVVTLVVIVVWTGWISFSAVSVWWSRLTTP